MQIAGYHATRTEFAEAGLHLSLYRVARLDELVDRDALLKEDLVPEPPYWAHLWVGALALARFLASSTDLSGRRVLDLGCGLGLTGLVAAAKGAEVWFADREPAALDFVRASAALNETPVPRVVQLDFTRDAFDDRFDVILGAEIVYDPATYLSLADFLDRHLLPGGVLVLTDAFRSDAETFFAVLRQRGFVGERHACREWEEGRPVGLFLWRFCR